MRILALDPGSEETGVIVLNKGVITHAFVESNETLLSYSLGVLGKVEAFDLIAIEMIAHYGTGLPAGKTVFDTCIFIGRVEQYFWPSRINKVLRASIKTHVCGTPRAKDGNVRQAMIDKLGEPGTKKKPGATHGITSHMWQALALAVYAQDNFEKLKNPPCITSSPLPSERS